MKTITLNNVQCIKQGTITIEENKINIKFGYNGLGKSSIGKGIQYFYDNLENPDDTKFNSLRTFRCSTNPTLEYDDPNNIFKSCLTFNNEYIKQWLFNAKDLVSKSYSAFFNNDDISEKKNDVDKLIQKVVESTNSKEINRYIDKFNEISSIIIFNKEGTKIRGGSKADKGLKNGANLVDTLPKGVKDRYEKWLTSKNSSDWATWFIKASKDLVIDDKCPYCGREFEEGFNSLKETLLEFFDTNDFKNNSLAKNAVNNLSKYSKKNNKEAISDINDESKPLSNDDVKVLSISLKDMAVESIKINQLRNNLKIYDVKDLNNVSNELLETLMESKLDLSKFENIVDIESGFTSLDFYNAASNVNKEIDNLISEIGVFSQAVIELNKSINDSIVESQNEINNFLELSGIPYKFSVEINGEEDAKTYIRPIEDPSRDIDDVDQKLSFGECNSFALALFGAIAKRNKADLIILDDPISSFDENKKFAVMHFLFNAKDGVLKDRTILMLTHDMEPVLDLVKIKGSIGTVARAHLLTKNAGIVTEKEITDKNIKNITEYEYVMAVDDKRDMYLRVSHLRKYIDIIGNRIKPINHDLYAILSSAEKCIDNPYVQDDKKTRVYFANNQKRFNDAIKEIKTYIPGFDYWTFISTYSNMKTLITLINATSDSYEKLFYLRRILKVAKDDGISLDIPDSKRNFITETYHVSSSYLYSLEENKQIPPYIEVMCKEIVDKITYIYAI